MSWLRILAADGKVKEFHVHKFPSRGIPSARIVEVDGAILARCTKSEKIYGIGRLPTANVEYIGWSWVWLPRVAKALRFLGAITKDDEAATLQAHNKAYMESKRAISEHQFRDAAERLGIDPAKAEALIKRASKTTKKTKGETKA